MYRVNKKRHNLVWPSLVSMFLLGAVCHWYVLASYHETLESLRIETEVLRIHDPLLPDEIDVVRDQIENQTYRDVAEVLRRVMDHLEVSGIAERSVTTGQSISNSHFEIVPVNISFQGQLREVFELLCRFHDDVRIVRLDKLDIAVLDSESGVLSVSITIGAILRNPEDLGWLN